jgi:hypothetical protein
MYNKYEMQLEIVVSEGSEESVIQTARRVYSAHVPVKDRSGEGDREISAEEFIGGLQGALLELVGRNPHLRGAGVEIRSVSCTYGEPVDLANWHWTRPESWW